MKRQTRTEGDQATEGRVLQYKLVGKDRIRVSMTPKPHIHTSDKCASCRMDEVVRAMGSMGSEHRR